MYDIDRNDEFSAFFRFLRDAVLKNEAETLVIAGDVYDKINPPNDAKRIYHNFLASMLGTCCKNIIVVGGNHDSGELLDSEKEILNQLNIHVIGKVSSVSTDEMVFELLDKDENICGICAAVPYVSEGELRNYFNEDVEDGAFSDKAYSVLYENVLESAEKLRNGRNIPLIATGHLYAADLEGKRAAVKQTEKIDDGVKALDVVGKLGFVSEKVFPKKFDYVALGHIHYPTMVAKNPKIRYSGSPFVMGFDETLQERDVLLVDIQKDEKQSFTVQKIEVPAFYDFRRIVGDSSSIKEELKKYQKNPPEKNTYIEIYYKVEDGIDIHAELEDTISVLPEKVFVVSWRPQRFGDVLTFTSGFMDTDELKNLTAEEVFTNLILAKRKIETEGLSEEEIEKAKKDRLNRFLPHLLKIAAEIEKGE